MQSEPSFPFPIKSDHKCLSVGELTNFGTKRGSYEGLWQTLVRCACCHVHVLYTVFLSVSCELPGWWVLKPLQVIDGQCACVLFKHLAIYIAPPKLLYTNQKSGNEDGIHVRSRLPVRISVFYRKILAVIKTGLAQLRNTWTPACSTAWPLMPTKRNYKAHSQHFLEQRPPLILQQVALSVVSECLK